MTDKQEPAIGEFRLVYDCAYDSGFHKYIVEQYRESTLSRIRRAKFPFIKAVYKWERFGGGYFFEDKTEALKSFKDLCKGRIIIATQGEQNIEQGK